MANGISDKFFREIQDAVGGFTLDAALENISHVLSAAENTAVDFLGAIEAPAEQAISFASDFAQFPDVGAGLEKLVGDVIQEASTSVANALDNAFPDFRADGSLSDPPFSPNPDINPPEPPLIDGKVYVVNGIRQDQDSRDAMGQETADMLGTDVTVVNNSTGEPFGILTDGWEYLAETFFGVPSPATETLANEIVNQLTSDPPQDIHLIGYSQGSMITAHALSLAVVKLREKGLSDEEIRTLMTEHVDVKLIATPVDPNNPAQVCMNVPPGFALPPGISDLMGQKSLDWFFTSEDRVLHGENPPSSETIRKESGETNFQLIRHEKDPVASWIHDLGLPDAAVAAEALILGPLMIFEPVGSIYLASRLTDFLVKLGVNQAEEGSAFGYHSYQGYYDYMGNNIYQA